MTRARRQIHKPLERADMDSLLDRICRKGWQVRFHAFTLNRTTNGQRLYRVTISRNSGSNVQDFYGASRYEVLQTIVKEI